MAAERIRPSATIILTRGDGDDIEVYLAERSMRTRFFPGYHAFPGGVLEKQDGDGPAGRRVAAVRETAEEVGVNVSTQRLVEAGTLITPPFGPVRYDTTFFVCRWQDGDTEPQVDGEELVSGKWWRPAEALAAFAAFDVLIPPPTLAYLHLLDAAATPEEAAAKARATDGEPHYRRFRIEFHPSVFVMPLVTPTLPPATTENVFVCDGATIHVIDPGTPHPEEQEKLFHLLDSMNAAQRPGRIVLTHHHSDHVGAVDVLRERYGWPVAASAETAKAWGGHVDEIVTAGDAFDVGATATAGANGVWQLEVLATPGHTQGHVALRDSRSGAIFAGDLLSGVSTILIDPLEGNMADYMASLAACAARAPRLVFPSHGPLLPGAAFAKVLAHRQMRETKVVAALSTTPATIDTLVPIVYDDTPSEAWALAARSLAAHLIKLESEGRAQRSDEGWRTR